MQIAERDKVALKNRPTHEVEGFKHLLNCIYNRPFELNHYSELENLARLADFYGAGSAASISLDEAMARSRRVVEYIAYFPISFLKIAYKLRNKVLYKECMVQIGGWSDFRPVIDGDEADGDLYEVLTLKGHPQLRRCALNSNAGIAIKLNKVNVAISKIVGNANTQLPPDAEANARI